MSSTDSGIRLYYIDCAGHGEQRFFADILAIRHAHGFQIQVPAMYKEDQVLLWSQLQVITTPQFSPSHVAIVKTRCALF